MVPYPLLNVHTIVVTYNGAGWIRTCLASLQGSSQPQTIHVIDNASVDDTVRIIRDEFPRVELIISPTNLGFGQANNLGLRRALDMGASHVFLLNQDAMVEPGTIGELIRAMEAEPGTAIISPLHLEGTGQRLDLNFLTYLSRSRTGTYLEGTLLGKERLPITVTTEFVNAAAWLLSRECLLTVGGFDPIFFHYGEDNHYCTKALHKKLDIRIHLGSRIRHDREQRQALEYGDPGYSPKWEWVQFLIYACDLRRETWIWFVVRTCAGQLVRSARALFCGQPGKASQKFGFATKILSNIPEITACRKRSRTADIVLGQWAATLLQP